RPPARTPEEEASFARMRAASRHLAEHLGEAPALVLVLMPNISMTLEDAEGPLDVGTPFASVYPAVQNLMLAARGLGIGTTLTTVYRVYQDEVRTICGIPERYEIVALVPMGRPVRPFRVGRALPAERLVGAEAGHDRSGDRRAAVAVRPAEDGPHLVPGRGRRDDARRDDVEREATRPVPGVDPPVDVEALGEREVLVGGDQLGRVVVHGDGGERETLAVPGGVQVPEDDLGRRRFEGDEGPLLRPIGEGAVARV